MCDELGDAIENDPGIILQRGAPSISFNTVNLKWPTIEECYKAIPFPTDERECAMFCAGIAEAHKFIGNFRLAESSILVNLLKGEMMDSDFVKKLSLSVEYSLVIERYTSAELSTSEEGIKQILLRGLVLIQAAGDGSGVVDNIYCDSATITFKKDTVQMVKVIT